MRGISIVLASTIIVISTVNAGAQPQTPQIPPFNEHDYPWKRVSSSKLFKALSIQYIAEHCPDNPFKATDLERSNSTIADSEPENAAIKLATEYYIKGIESKHVELAERCKALIDIGMK